MREIAANSGACHSRNFPRQVVRGLAISTGIITLAIQTGGCGRGADSRDNIVIAAAGPMTGSSASRGNDLQQAAKMAVEETNAAGGINGKRIQVDVYDDADQPSRASELALRIATATRARAVLGQVASSAAFAAGQVYKAQSIPAITGAASEARVTRDNGWYFRLLRDAGGQGAVLADYARYQLGGREIAVIREKGTAGEEFASNFRDRAKSLGMRIAADVEFTPADAAGPSALAGVVSKLSKVPKGTMIVLGSQYAESPALLKALREKLGAFPCFGYSSLATENLAASLAEAEKNASLAPGYYTGNLIVAAPQLGDIAEHAQTVFASHYEARYGKRPNPEAVRWYEGTMLILQAIRSTGATSDLAADRRKIRDWLAALNRPETAVAGVGGPIYFDRDHNVRRGTSIGLFYGGHLISAPVQFTEVARPEQVPGWDRLQASGMVIDSAGTRFVKTPVIYAGIEMNSLDNIDVRTGTFSADFFFWLRSQDQLNLDPHEVEFPTAVSGGQLGKEVGHRSHAGFNTVTYQVKGVFRSDYEFSRFPFDEQTLKIPIQFHNSNSYTMLLAYGRNGAAPSPRGPAEQPVLASKLWQVKDEIFYRDVVAYKASFGDVDADSKQANVEVNRINAAITIRRDVFGFAVKNFLPLVCILVAVLIGYALAPDVINPRVSIGVTALLTTSVLYQKLAGDLPTVTYITAMDYVFFAYFGFCVIFLLLTVVTYDTHKMKKDQLSAILNRGGVAITVLSLAATLMFVWGRYWGQA